MAKRERNDDDSTSSTTIKAEGNVKTENDDSSSSSSANKRARSSVPNSSDLEEYIEVKIETAVQIEGYTNDIGEIELMHRMGLPTGFSNLSRPSSNEGSSKKVEKRKYMCNLCDCELTSDIAKATHLKGEKHLKLLRIKKQQQSDLGTDTQLWNRHVGTSEAGKKNVPIRLHEKLAESNENAIGLKYVTEYLAVSNCEMEPHYNCGLCSSKGIANGMYSHVIGKKHRQAVIDKRFPNDPDYMDVNAKQMSDYAEENSENSQAEQLINTIRSDEEYPWPEGFQPWNLENDGAVVAPSGAKENFGITKFQKSQKFTIREEILPHPDEIQPPSTLEETDNMIRFYKQLMDRVAEYIGGETGDKLKKVHHKFVDQLRKKKGLDIQMKTEKTEK